AALDRRRPLSIRRSAALPPRPTLPGTAQASRPPLGYSPVDNRRSPRFRRLKCRQRSSAVASRLPHVARVRVLVLLRSRSKLAVPLPLPIRIEPENLDLLTRPIPQRYLRFRSSAAAPPRCIAR